MPLEQIKRAVAWYIKEYQGLGDEVDISVFFKHDGRGQSWCTLPREQQLKVWALYRTSDAYDRDINHERDENKRNWISLTLILLTVLTFLTVVMMQNSDSYF